MKKIIAILFLSVILCGCNDSDSDINRALELRNNLISAKQCSFTVAITADYPSACYAFKMDCTSDDQGDIQFVVKEPETISGIAGQISGEGGKLTFEDKYLVFATMADGEITPVSSPWLFLSALRSGYISGCAKEEDGMTIVCNDSYHDNQAEVHIKTDSNCIPVAAEIYWQGRRVVTMIVENFTIV